MLSRSTACRVPPRRIGRRSHLVGLTEREGGGGGGEVETEEGEEDVDLYTTMDEEEASNLYQDLLSV